MRRNKSLGLAGVSISGMAIALMSAPAHAQEVPDPVAQVPDSETPPEASAPDATQPEGGEIVVTARRREERLIDVPVSVTAITSDELERYKADTLEKVGELTPGVVIGAIKHASGGSIAVRGISSSPATVGFEQAVQVNIDGIPISNGRVVGLGFFDLERVEVLKGPQALLFGKNNTAGVIALVSADPTSELSGFARVGYEFVADEIIGEAAVSGPLTDTLGARLAVRARHMKGWMYNTSRAMPNPFFPAYPLDDPDHRLGDKEISGRLTLKYEPTPDLDVTLKVHGSHAEDDGFGLGQQVIGGCLDDQPIMFGRVDPFGECERDNRTQMGQPHPEILANGPDPEGPRGEMDTVVGSLNASYDLGWGDLTSTTGYVWWDAKASGAGSAESFAQLFGSEPQTVNSFTQEVRLLTAFDSPFNVMVGGFYQDFDFDYSQDVKLLDPLSFNPANGLFIAWLRPGYTHGKTYSVFAQAIYRPSPQWEIAGGARYTAERKNSFSINEYAVFPGFPQGKSLSDRFKDSNISPELTVTYHPTDRTTIYGAYKTGFKSGGFALSGTIQTNTRASDLDFDSETARGFELGAKGQFLGNRLRLELVGYRYKFEDLQVTSYNPESISFTFSNVASMKQRGLDFQATYQAHENLQLRTAVNYNRNRFGRYFGPCYGLQTPDLGCNITPGPAQDLTGRPPARSPDWAGNAGLTGDMPLGNAMKVSLSSDLFYTSGYWASETLAPTTRQDGFVRWNAGLRLLDEGERWELGLIGRNLTNKYYLLQAQDKTGRAGDQKGTVARGREIMVQGTVRF